MANYIFNPDTEMALASGGESYTPPLSVQRFINKLALIPALYAKSGSVDIVPDSVIDDISHLPYYDVALQKNISIKSWSQFTPDKTIPWGWNRAMANALLKKGVPESYILDSANLNKLRDLAHRKSAITLHRQIAEQINNIISVLPQYFSDLKELKQYVTGLVNDDKKYVVKLPWSSSGRGVFFNPNISNVIKAFSRQKGLIIEPYWDKAIDFASEWESKDSKIYFKGFSIFIGSESGNYSGNLVASQQYIKDIICSHCESSTLERILQIQSEYLTEQISPYYKGCLGIDMLCDKTGHINPCVEINLRMTMGHVAISLYDQFGLPDNEPYYFYPGKDLLFG